MNITDLTDPAATYHYLDTSLSIDPDVDDARAVVDEALSFARPPAGAHVIAARLAELDRDIDGFERATRAALRVDDTFTPAIDDLDFIGLLRAGPGPKAGARKRATHLYDKLDAFADRPHVLRAQLEFAGRALGFDDPVERGLDCMVVAETQLFLALLVFEGGLVERLADEWGEHLPASERQLLRSWRGARHRRYRLQSATRARATLLDVETGELVEVEAPLRDSEWTVGRDALAVVVPVGSRATVVGSPLLIDADQLDDLADQLREPASLAGFCIRVLLVAAAHAMDDARADRIRLLFPDLDPDEVDDDERALLERVRGRAPDLARRADDGDHLAEAELLLDAIVAHRIITLHRPHTWALAERLLDLGAAPDEVLGAVREAVRAEMWQRRHGDAA